MLVTRREIQRRLTGNRDTHVQGRDSAAECTVFSRESLGVTPLVFVGAMVYNLGQARAWTNSDVVQYSTVQHSTVQYMRGTRCLVPLTNARRLSCTVLFASREKRHATNCTLDTANLLLRTSRSDEHVFRTWFSTLIKIHESM